MGLGASQDRQALWCAFAKIIFLMIIRLRSVYKLVSLSSLVACRVAIHRAIAHFASTDTHCGLFVSKSCHCAIITQEKETVVARREWQDSVLTDQIRWLRKALKCATREDWHFEFRISPLELQPKTWTKAVNCYQLESLNLSFSRFSRLWNGEIKNEM